MSEQVDVSTICPKTQQQVTITLQPTAWISTTKKTIGAMVTGRPVACSLACEHQGNIKCLLHHERLTTGRKR